MVTWWFGARWFGFLGSSHQRDCYFKLPQESNKKMEGCLVGPTIMANWWLGPLSINPFHKGIPKIQTTNSNHQLTKNNNNGSICFWFPDTQWGWYIYLHEWLTFMVHVSEYTIDWVFGGSQKIKNRVVPPVLGTEQKIYITPCFDGETREKKGKTQINVQRIR